MTERDTLTLTIHGLPAFNKDVDGEVFARKFFKFMQALGAADESANGGRRLRYLIHKLEKNTATASVREQLASDGPPPASGVDFFQRAALSIYHDRPEARVLPVRLVRYVEEISNGAGETFAKGEIKRSANDNVISIDDNLRKNARRVLVDISRLNQGQVEPFSGVANISLDGTVIMLDGRGEGDRAVIVLTAGGKSVDCFVDRIPDLKLREVWKKRCTVLGVGHYSGNKRLPDYIEAVRIDPIGDGTGWRRWKGAFPSLRVDESDWH